ncbi:MAG: hypothetical protein BWY15_02275 [Firmicutes bacterium ADurb.Bin193]|nr:MAG: hypothetical protein BWY15_02275 [Firmicutes bacterium ADurb.Bin193]
MDRKQNGKAYFVRNARTIDDLKNHRKKCIEKNSEGNPYVIEKIIELSEIDFENFSTDLLTDRQFIEDNIDMMFSDTQNVWHCLLIVPKGRRDTGILVESKKNVYAMYSAVVE